MKTRRILPICLTIAACGAPSCSAEIGSPGGPGVGDPRGHSAAGDSFDNVDFGDGHRGDDRSGDDHRGDDGRTGDNFQGDAMPVEAYCGSLRSGTVAWGPPGQTSADQDYAPGSGPEHVAGRVVAVATMATLEAAINAAQPGDAITLAPGNYDFSGRFIVDSPGTYDDPIFVRAETLGTATINLRTGDEAFSVRAPFWIFENLVLAGDCQGTAAHCEHAFHITGKADRIIIRNSHIIDFVTHVKSNGGDFYDAGAGCAAGSDGVQDEFPDDLWFIGNKWWRTYVPQHNAPTNILNLDGGRRNIVRGNVMAEFVRPSSGHASGVYPKAGMRDLLVEQNLIVCSKNLSAGNDTAAINLGDGMGSEGWCDGACYTEGQNLRAIVRNNITANCLGPGNSNGLLILSDVESNIYANSFVNVKNNFFRGIPISNTVIGNNILYKPVTVHADNNPITLDNNLSPGSLGAMNSIFQDPVAGNWTLKDGASVLDQGTAQPGLTHDFCGYPREGVPDLGAIEYGANAAACVAKIQALWDDI